MSVSESQRKAALDDTWTGKRAKNLQLTTVTVILAFGPEGAWDTVEIVFST